MLCVDEKSQLQALSLNPNPAVADAPHYSLGLLLAQKGNHTAATGPRSLGPVAAGDLEKVKALLKGNPDLVFSKDNDGETPLYWAVIRGHKDVAELLLASKADVNAKDNDSQTPSHPAAFKGSKGVAELLLAKKADVNARVPGVSLETAAKERCGSSPGAPRGAKYAEVQGE